MKPKVFVLSIAIFIVLCLLIGGVYANYILGQFNYENGIFEKYDVDSLPDEDKIDSSIFPGGTLPLQGELLKDDEIVNILLVGCDAPTIKDRGRSDSMMIATIDMKHKKLKLTSILRDTYVELPGTDNNGKKYGWKKLNSAYYYGDATFLKETIQHNFNIAIDKYVVVNFSIFRDVIDIIGGIDIKLSAMEAEYLKGRRLDEAGPNKDKVKEGINTLDGWLALEFSRARHGENNKPKAGPFTYIDTDGNEVTVNDDYARTARQRYVMETAFKKMKGQDIPTLLSVAEECFKNIRTDMTMIEVTKYIKSVLSLNAEGVSQLQIPYKGTFIEEKNPAFLRMTDDNIQNNIDKLKEFIYEK